MIESFRDLLVWQKAMFFAQRVYEISRSFPNEEKFSLTSQVHRSSLSIPSNIAEGFGRGSRADYKRFLQIARGSLYESQTQLELAVKLNFLRHEDFQELENIATEVGKMLNGLISKLKE